MRIGGKLRTREVMGMTRRLIEESRTTTPMSNEEIVETLKTMVFGAQAFERFDAKERETLDKTWNIIDQYENRLKADMAAMLTEIQMEIEESDSRAGYAGNGMPTFSTDYIRKKKVNELIQQKINALRGGKNDNN